MKRHLVRVLALAAAFLLTACAARLPSPEARRAPSTAESAVSAAAVHPAERPVPGGRSGKSAALRTAAANRLTFFTNIPAFPPSCP